MSSSSSAASSSEDCPATLMQGPVRPPAFNNDTERPCEHNHWTKQTKKRGKLVLRCNICQVVWKTRPEAHKRCAAFHAGRCEKGGECPHPHIYARHDGRRWPQQGSHWHAMRTMNHFLLPPAAISPVQGYDAAPLPAQWCGDLGYQQQQPIYWTHNPYGV